MTSRLDQARQLMESAELEAMPERKLADIKEALDLIAEYLDGRSENSREYDLANNLRRTHIRRLIEQIVSNKSLRADDAFGLWFDYFRFFFFEVRDVVDSALSADPDLQRRYKAFEDIGVPQLLEAAKLCGLVPSDEGHSK
ncbi:hypothetical protein [Dyella choica]|uniref:Uncharacterized protein n=1 Tax=Dyella choica TaxID=1927959 RepID=A0A3S0RZH6_9GAMM|nr:hypothetical protein [Dyella choica]RUL74077.1 hypothetical protein EKH80_14710 [Dyella choica]